MIFGIPELLIGMLTGLTYALLGVGLVLVYRASRVLHLGYGEIGAFGAILLAKLVLDGGISWWLAFPLCVALGAAISAGWELLVIRRLSDSSRSIVLVATIAIAQLMYGAQLLLPEITNRGLFPTGVDLRVDLGSVLFRGDHLLILIVVPLVTGGLVWFLNRTITGLAIRGAAENADAARLAGVKVERLSTLVWAMAGALATATFVLILPVRGLVFGANVAAVGPILLLRALTVAMIGRMVSLPMVIAGGVLFGIAEVTLLANVGTPGTVDFLVFLLVLVLLLVRGVAEADTSPGAIASRVRRLPTELAAHPTVRRLTRGVLMAIAGVAIAAPLLTSDPGQQYAFARLLVFALIAMSAVIIVGWGGHLSLGQFAFVGLGAMITAGLTSRGMGFGWALVYAAAGCGLAATTVGFPALRLKGPFLAIATLGFAIASRGFFLDQAVFFEGERRAVVPRPSLGPIDFSSQRMYYFLCLVLLVLIGLAMSRFAETGSGRAIVAVRENENAAAAFGIAPAATKLLAFTVSGAVAGVAGALYAGLNVTFGPFDFGPETSLQVLTMAVVGGLGSIAGAVLGAVYALGVPALFGSGPIALAMTGGLGTLLIVLFARGGLLDVVLRAREAIARRITGISAAEADDPDEDAPPPARPHLEDVRLPRRPVTVPDDGRVLICEDVSVTFGGLKANDQISLEVRQGQVVGLIGTNGAGKSTLMNAISGFVPVSGGRIRVFGTDVTGLAPHERAALGMGRIFQEARLFGQMTVMETVLISLEARERSEPIGDMLQLPPAKAAERARRSAASDLLDLTGLGPYGDRLIVELSTGMRRICELACLLGSGARMVMLDEPTGGVAQAEVEAFGRVLMDARRHLDASMLLIEHDMPLIMRLSDHVVCMTAGQVIAQGPPEVVREDPSVIASYLGTDETAITRSDASPRIPIPTRFATGSTVPAPPDLGTG